MLTVILLVVLAGGAGLLAVWSVDPDGLKRVTDRVGKSSLRAFRERATATPEPVHDDDAPPANGPPELPDRPVEEELEVVAAPTSTPQATGAGAPVDYAPLEVPAASGPPRRRRRGSVPKGFTAVEGSYRDVAAVPPWRKALSLALLLVILFAAGVVAAALAGAALGAAAELVNSAV